MELGLTRQPDVALEALRLRHGEHRRLAGAHGLHPPATQRHRGAGGARPHPARPRLRNARGSVPGKQNDLAAVAAHRGGIPRRRVQLPRHRLHRQPLRRRHERHRQPQAQPDLRPVVQDGIIPQRRLRLPFQRRARRGRPAHPGQQRAKGSVNPLVKTQGAEVGVRTTAVPGLQSSLTLWILDLDSELVFDGRQPPTTNPAVRAAVWAWSSANFYTPTPWLTLDLDFAYSNARFTDHDPAGPWVPEAIETTLDAGRGGPRSRARAGEGVLRRLAVAFFGPRNLDRGRQRRSRMRPRWFTCKWVTTSTRRGKSTSTCSTCSIRRTADIDYYYVSRLPGEPAAGVADRHTHQSEPRELRGGVTAHF